MKKLLLSLGTVAAVVAPVASVVACGSSKTKAETTDMAERLSVLDKIKAASGYDTMTDAQKKAFDAAMAKMSLGELKAEVKKLATLKDQPAPSTKGSQVTDEENSKVIAKALAEYQALSDADKDALIKEYITDDIDALADSIVQTQDRAEGLQEGLSSYQALSQAQQDALVKEYITDGIDSLADSIAQRQELIKGLGEGVSSASTLVKSNDGQETLSKLLGSDLFDATNGSLEEALASFNAEASPTSDVEDTYASPAVSKTSTVSGIEAVVTSVAVTQAGALSQADLDALGLDAAALKDVTDAFDAA